MTECYVPSGLANATNELRIPRSFRKRRFAHIAKMRNFGDPCDEFGAQSTDESSLVTNLGPAGHV